MAERDWLENYIRKDAELKGGHFLYFDEKTQRLLVLDFHGVHPMRVHETGENEYMACVDMRSQEGEEFDLDFFLKNDPNGPAVTGITVHRADGQPRYNWYSDQGKLKQSPVCQI